MFNFIFPHSLARTEMYIFVSYAIHNEQGRYVSKLRTYMVIFYQKFNVCIVQYIMYVCSEGTRVGGCRPTWCDLGVAEGTHSKL